MYNVHNYFCPLHKLFSMYSFILFENKYMWYPLLSILIHSVLSLVWLQCDELINLLSRCRADGWFCQWIYFIVPIKILLLSYFSQSVINIEIRPREVEANIYDRDVLKGWLQNSTHEIALLISKGVKYL